MIDNTIIVIGNPQLGEWHVTWRVGPMAANDLVQTCKDLPKITLVLENVKQ
jgi:hypothetical protein